MGSQASRIAMTSDQRLFDAYVSSHFQGCHRGNADEYESYRRHYLRTLAHHLPQERSARILDVGCGMGHLLYFLKHEGYENHQGIDVGPEQVEWCRTRVTDRVELVADTMRYLESRQGAYDAITCFDVLEHLDREVLLDTVIAIRGALAEGGRFVVKVPNAACITALMTRYGDLTHHRLFTEGSLSQLFKAAGFPRIDIHPDEYKPIREFPTRVHRWSWSLRDRAIRWWMAKCYDHLMEGANPRVQTINLLAIACKPDPSAPATQATP
jgi:2-polyprenyl-3-methyl-5-hydroxy-6-metoxy-1,4-benzoquinol methylase